MLLHTRCRQGRSTAVALLLLGLLLRAPSASAFEFFEGKVQVHGYVESQLRMISDGFRNDRWFFSQWANIMNLEFEWDIASDGWGPFDSISAFVRAEVRFDCIWSQACGLSPSTRLFGNRANRVPQNLGNGVTSGFSGVLPSFDSERIQNTNANLVEFFRAPPLDRLAELGATNLLGTFRPVLGAVIGTKQLGGSLGPQVLPLGPWRPETNIRPNAALASVPNVTGPRPPLQQLPFRPAITNEALGIDQAHGLYAPSQALLARMDDFGVFDQNFSQGELQWNRGGSQQQTGELKEAYLDVDLLEGSLFLRIGRQSIVWGKTELFRTTDQFNPQDLALSSLPSLEESRIPLWSIRAIYSLYDVGPLDDVRIELAANFDEFEPLDLGKCGEPYTIFLVCAKSYGLFGHGLIGAGIAGEVRPDNPWDNISGLEFGARIEFRWDRFSFALTDFWGYSDAPTVDYFNEYQRSVFYDPSNPNGPDNGRPLDVNGNFLTAENAVKLHPANRQTFDVTCSVTVGIAAAVLPALGDACLLDLLNSNAAVLPPALTPANALGPVLAGTPFASFFVLPTLAGLPLGQGYRLVELNRDPGDGPSGGPFAPAGGLGAYLTDAQEALLGCGRLYGTDCDTQGIDLFNAEASVLIQSFPQFEPGGPVATRFVNGQLIQLPGSRGPGDPDYLATIDGCTGLTDPSGNPIPGCQASNGGAGARVLVDPLTGQRYANELGALSYNFMILLYALGSLNPQSSECFTPSPAGANRVPTLDQLIRCQFVKAVFAVTGTQRPDLRAGGNGRYGRRDFLWSSGSEIQLFYQKRNVLGLSTDFADDWSKTNWSMEFTWFANEAFSNTTQPRGFSNMDSLNLTVSVDRPTIINFLNQGRTFFFNSQWFVRYLPEYRGLGTFNTNGPWSILGTFTVATGYFQDRLLPALTTVYDVQSRSGAILGSVTYRFSEVFSASVGVANFWGKPADGRIPIRQALLGNNGGNFETRTRFEGLSPIAERDEVYLTLRYTF